MTHKRPSNPLSSLFSNTFLALAFCFITLFSVACGVETNSRVELATSGGNEDIGLQPGADLDPTDGTTPVNPGKEPDCETFETLSISPNTIDFGLRQLEDKECEHIQVNGCVGFNAEIVYPDGTSDDDQQFGFFDAAGNELSGRQAGVSEGIDLCYKRTVIGDHSARVNVVIDSGSMAYATVIPVKGSTADYVFDLDSPTEGMLVWEQDGVSTYDAAAGTFTIAVKGTVNTNLSSVITGTDVTVKGGMSTVTLPAGNNSFEGEFKLPFDPKKVYPITISIPSQKGDLEMVRHLIRYTSPTSKMEIRDASGGIVNAAVTDTPGQTDSTILTLGINVSNLDVSGPSKTKPVHIKTVIKHNDQVYMSYNANDKEWTGDPDEVSTFDMYVGLQKSEEEDPNAEEGVNGHCSSKFNSPTSTYCIVMPPTASLQKGTSIIETTLCNDYTTFSGSCTVETTSIVVDNDIPNITIQAPLEDHVYPLIDEPKDNSEKIKGTITIDNFVMYDVTKTTDDDGKEVETKSCAVKLWLNAANWKDGQNVGTFIPLCDNNTTDKFTLKIIASEDGSTSNGNTGNIRRAVYEMYLDNLKKTITDTATNTSTTFFGLTQFTNLMFIETHNASGHYAYKAVSFQRGKNKKANFNSTGAGIGELSTGPMGSYNGGDHIQNAPIMLYLGEGTLQKQEIKNVIRKLLNDNLNFADLAMGFPTDEIKEKPFGVFDPDWSDTNDKNEIIRLLHRSAPEQVMAIWNYQSAQGSTEKYFPSDIASDQCGNPITTAIVSPDMYQYMYALWGKVTPSFFTDPDYGLKEWPTAICADEKKNKGDKNVLNCNTFEQGVWDVDVNLKNDGFVDAKLSLNGKVDENGDVGPALAGHFNAYNLIDEGTTGALTLKDFGLADPIIPLFFNVGKMTINLKDILRIVKAKKDEDGHIVMQGTGKFYDLKKKKYVDSCSAGVDTCVEESEPAVCDNSNCTNMLYIYPYRRLESEYMDLQFDPYKECSSYFKKRWPNATVPLGCNDETKEYYPFTVDTNSVQGDLLLRSAHNGEYDTLNLLIHNVLDATFRNILGCLPDSMVNPMIDSEAFRYASWVPQKERKPLEFGVGTDKNGDVAFGFKKDLEKEDGTSIAFTVKPDIKDADLNINDNGILAKLGIEKIGADDVSETFYNRGDDTTRSRGYIYRDPVNLDSATYPYGQEEVNNGQVNPYLSLSLNAEQVLNGALYTLIEKGLWDVLKLADVDEDLQGPKGYNFDNWTIGVDKVILGRFDMCGPLSLANTDLSPSIVFEGIKDFFENDISHLDISVKSAPTIAILPMEGGDENTALLQIGIPNLEIAVKSLLTIPAASEDELETYTVGNKVVTVRGDVLLRLAVRVIDNGTNGQTVEIYILPQDQQVFYFSAIDRGLTINDQGITRSLYSLILPNLFGGLAKPFKPEDPESLPSFGVEIVNNKLSGLNVASHITQTNIGNCNTEGENAHGPAPEYGVPPPPPPPTITIGGELGEAIKQWLIDIFAMMQDAVDAKGGSTTPESKPLIPRFDFTPMEFIPYNSDENTAAEETCDLLADENDAKEEADNLTLGDTLRESVCETGISDVSLNNFKLNFDHQNGYIHFGTGMHLELYEWLYDELDPSGLADDKSTQWEMKQAPFNPNLFKTINDLQIHMN
ncbi:hypothetical protein K1X76_02460 [bacterium]|nr:hypothetical protein [bacterium]